MICSIDNSYQHFEYLLAGFLTIGVFDLFLYLTKMNASRWFKLHILANSIACIGSYPDFMRLFLNPSDANIEGSLVPTNITMALHLYHMVVFKNLQPIDWIHHLVMMFILGLTYLCPNPSLTNYILFFCNGLPGGIDYVLLVLVKMNKLEKITEKRLNSNINVWFRGPGIIIGAYIIFTQWYHGLIPYSGWLVAIVVIGLIWNAQYFTSRVVFNYGFQFAGQTIVQQHLE